MTDRNRDRTERGDTTQLIDMAPVVAGDQKEFLLLIHVGESKDGAEGKEIGRRYDLDKESITIGRDAGNDIVLDLDTVSRRHARIDRSGGRTTLTDLESTNGTYIDEQRILPFSPQEIPRPARMMIGRAIFKYQTGDDLDLQYTEEVYQLKITDGLTGLPNRRRLMEVLDCEIGRARRYHRELCLVMIDVDYFKRINDTLGHLAGDQVLRELANVVSMRVRQGEVFARYGGDEFVLVLPETNKDQALQVAERLRQRIEACEFQFAARKVPLTVSAGVAQYEDDKQDQEALLKVVDDRLYGAKRAGRNRVNAGEIEESLASEKTVALRRILDGDILLREVLSRETCGPLVGFEIGEEAAVVESLGASGREQWMRELVGDVERATSPGEMLGSVSDRYALVALSAVPSGRADVVVADVRRLWTARPVPDAAHTALTRSLRSAALTPEELRQNGEKALDVLIARLLRVSQAASADRRASGPLPFPLAAPAALVRSRQPGLAHVKALTDAIEVSVRFTAAAELGALIQRLGNIGEDRLADAVVRFVDRPLSMGGWMGLGTSLASLTPSENTALAQVADACFSGRGRHSTRLSKRLHEAVACRNRVVGHGASLPDDAYGDEEETLLSVLEDLLKATGPLSRLRLVSVAEIEDLAVGEDLVRYRFRLHQGPGEQFELFVEDVRARLWKEWCYLIGEKGESPIPLAPIVFAKTCETCRRVEVFMTDKLTLGPEAASVTGRGVTSNHEASIKIPRWAELQSLWRSAEQIGRDLTKL